MKRARKLSLMKMRMKMMKKSDLEYAKYIRVWIWGM